MAVRVVTLCMYVYGQNSAHQTDTFQSLLTAVLLNIPRILQSTRSAEMLKSLTLLFNTVSGDFGNFGLGI